MKTPNPDHPIRNTLKHLALASTMGAALYFGAAPASAAPPVTTDLKLHLDASAIVTLSDGDPVTTWTDSSGMGGDVTTLGSAPSYQAVGIGGLPTVQFDAGEGLGNLVNYSPPVTIFYVSRQTGGANLRVLAAQMATTGCWATGAAVGVPPITMVMFFWVAMEPRTPTRTYIRRPLAAAAKTPRSGRKGSRSPRSGRHNGSQRHCSGRRRCIQ